jgi:hypothetical protein
MTSTPSFSSILAEADSIVSGDRQGTYGSPEDCFGLIADLWNGWLGFGPEMARQSSKIAPLSASDVAIMMMLLKVARTKPAVLADQPIKRDTLVDLAGYAACLARVQDALPGSKEESEPILSHEEGGQLFKDAYARFNLRTYDDEGLKKCLEDEERAKRGEEDGA